MLNGLLDTEFFLMSMFQ